MADACLITPVLTDNLGGLQAVLDLSKTAGCLVVHYAGMFRSTKDFVTCRQLTYLMG